MLPRDVIREITVGLVLGVAAVVGLVVLGRPSLPTAPAVSPSDPAAKPLLRKPLLPIRRADDVQEFEGTQFHEGWTGPDGTEPMVDPSQIERKRNVGGRDGAGLCVFTSAEYTSRYQNERRLFDLQHQMTREPGGGWPDKLQQMIAKYGAGADSNLIQSTAGDPTIIELLLRTGRMPCVTYAGMDSRYRGGINHMVNCVHLDPKWGAIMDNNFPDKPLWMSREAFLERWRARGGGWVAGLLNPPPPPPPHN